MGHFYIFILLFWNDNCFWKLSSLGTIGLVFMWPFMATGRWVIYINYVILLSNCQSQAVGLAAIFQYFHLDDTVWLSLSSKPEEHFGGKVSCDAHIFFYSGIVTFLRRLAFVNQPFGYLMPSCAENRANSSNITDLFQLSANGKLVLTSTNRDKWAAGMVTNQNLINFNGFSHSGLLHQLNTSLFVSCTNTYIVPG